MTLLRTNCAPPQPITEQGTKVCRYNWHSAGSLGWPFPTLKYEYIFQIKYTEAILSNNTRKLLWLEITRILIAVLRNKFTLLFIIISGKLSFPISQQSAEITSTAHHETRETAQCRHNRKFDVATSPTKTIFGRLTCVRLHGLKPVFTCIRYTCEANCPYRCGSSTQSVNNSVLFMQPTTEGMQQRPSFCPYSHRLSNSSRFRTWIEANPPAAFLPQRSVTVLLVRQPTLPSRTMAFLRFIILPT